MSKKIDLDMNQNNLRIQKKEKDEIEGENERMDKNINIPKVSMSNSNDISKLNSSFLSYKNSEYDNKANSDHKSMKRNSLILNSNLLDLDNDIDYIINNENEDKKDSNFSSEKVLYDEIKNAEKMSAENENNLSNISKILTNKNKRNLDYIIQNRIMKKEKAMNKSDYGDNTNNSNKNLDSISNINNNPNHVEKTNLEIRIINLNKGFVTENNSKVNHDKILNNSFIDKEKYNDIDLVKRINKINNKINNVIRNTMNTNSCETELASKITDNTSLYKNTSNIKNDKNDNKNSKSSCFKSLCFSGGEKKN